MAKKSSGSLFLAGIAIMIAIIASVPREVWIGLIALGIIVVIYRQFTKSTSTIDTSKNKTQYSRGRNSSDDLISVSVRSGSEREFLIPSASLQDMANAKWIAPGEHVTISGMDIPGGMIYVGKSNKSGTDPALINPNLKVASTEVDISRALTDYWPSYSTISPEARKAYLRWLADGRNAPSANIGYIFLFFYGLERRVLIDAQTDPKAKQEIQQIKAEIERLANIYSSDHSFLRYSTNLLEFIASTQVEDKIYLSPPPTISNNTWNYELPINLRIGLGQIAYDQKAVPTDWALAWALAEPNIRRRTPATRCADLFSTLFKQKYSENYGDGLILKPNRTKLKAFYHPASSGLRYSDFNRSINDLPDVSAVKTPVTKLQKIVDECADELDSYSRFLGRNPDKAEALEALLQLPVTLWPAEIRSELEDIKSRIGQGLVLMSFGELSGRLKSAGVLSREKVLGLARALQSLHVGMEPDVLTGGKTPTAEDKIALFSTPPEDSTLRNSAAFNAAVITLDLSCGAALADGEVSAHELLHLTRQIDSWAHLSDAHRKRLKAHLRLGIEQPIPLSSLKKKMEPLPIETKRSIGLFLSHLAQADGQVSPSEVKFLERVYKTLNLDQQLLYSDLHSVPAKIDTVTPSAEKSPLKVSSTSGFTLDKNRIAQLQKETEAVSTLLASVFTEEQLNETLVDKSIELEDHEHTDSSILGLNTDQSAFLRKLISRQSWSREDLDDVAADMELMLDGTLELVNETMLDKFDLPLTEGDDPIEINQEVLEQIPL